MTLSIQVTDSSFDNIVFLILKLHKIYFHAIQKKKKKMQETFFSYVVNRQVKKKNNQTPKNLEIPEVDQDFQLHKFQTKLYSVLV